MCIISIIHDMHVQCTYRKSKKIHAALNSYGFSVKMIPRKVMGFSSCELLYQSV